MRVNRLSLHGFKSFANRSELEFGPGVTAIVGPNGSGKSNLVDAIRLVLGETSARELRGQRLDQVIFAGGEKRAPVGMAEVTLVFDNEDGRLPVDDVEVAITRRIFRDGNSEFRRNGTRVRLRDLDRLLDATGLAQAGYAVIAQNDIESIIRATPGQRRHLIEEAAGVRGAQSLIEDSRSRLASIDQWLEGSQGRLGELLPRIEALQIEAEMANEAARLKGRLQQLRGSLERAAWLQALSQCRRTERSLQAQEKRLEQLEESVQGFRQRYQGERLRLEQLAASRLEAERQHGRLELASQQAQAQIDRWQDRATQAAAARSDASGALAEASDDLRALGADGGLSLESGHESEAARQELAAREGQVLALKETRDRLRSQLMLAREEVGKAEAAASESARRRNEVELRLAAATTAQAQNQEALSGTGEKLEHAGAELRAVESGLEAAEVVARRLRAELEATAAQESESLADLEAAERELSVATVRLGEAEARRAGWTVSLDSRAGQGPLTAAAEAGELRLTRLSSQIRAAAPEDSLAVEVGLGALAEALFGDEAEAQRALAMAGASGEAVCWSVVRAELPELPTGCRPLSSALAGDPAALRTVASICRLVCLAQDRAAARDFLSGFPDGRAILPDGTVLGRAMAVTPPAEEGTLRLTSRLLDAEAAVQQQQASLALCQEQLDRCRSLHQERRHRVDQLRQEAGLAANSESGIRQQRERLVQVVAETRQGIAEIERRAEQIAARELADRQLRDELEAARRSKVALAAQKNESASQLGTQFSDAEAELSAATHAMDSARQALVRIEGELRAAVERFKAAELRRQQLAERRQVAERRLAATELSAIEALIRLRASRADLESAQADLERYRSQQEAASSPELDPLQQIAHLERSRAELEGAARAALNGVEALRRELSGQRETAERLRAEVAPTQDRAEESEAVEPEDPARVAQEVSRLERRLSGLGPINELAPEHLAELLERTSDLRSAHADCLAARGELDLVLGGLQRITSRRFEITLSEVRREFEEVWAELFGGGRATILTVPLEGLAMPGIDLQVQPRGKRVVPIALLSGGERALTALALVLALQKVSPSPFYVFDEVDAALDEANIRHFADLLKRRGAESQFLVVTHSLTTMSRASILYGVTQDGRGASRILSVRLSADGQGIEDGAGEPVLEAALG